MATVGAMTSVHDSLSRSSAPSSPITVKVLGSLDVLGAERPFHRAGTRELVAYLALHPDGVRTDQWVTALWPDRQVAAPTIHSTSSAARRSLGRTIDGRDLLPHAHGRLRLDPSVKLDLDLVESAIEDTPEVAERAVELIDGRPFAELATQTWVVTEGHLARAEEAISSLCRIVARRKLRAGSPSAARSILRRGVEAVPYDESLWRLLFEATAAEGNLLGLDRLVTELAVTAGAHGGHVRGFPPRGLESYLHRSTWELYLRLRGATAVLGQAGPPRG